MSRKKSGRAAAGRFVIKVEEVEAFCKEVDAAKLSKSARSSAYDAALIKVVVAFEKFILEIMSIAINNDTSTISDRVAVKFPRHLSYEVCEYLITGTGYFDWRGGRGGLIKTLKTYLPGTHWLVTTASDVTYRDALDRLLLLRHHAAHESRQSKAAVMKVLAIEQMGTAGSWVKVGNRMPVLTGQLKALGRAVEAKAPY